MGGYEEDSLEKLEEFLKGVVRAGGFDLTVEIEESDEVVEARLDGADSEILLENSGKVLDALNDLVNQIFFRRLGRRIELDSDDFRAMRIIELEQMAKHAAEKTRLSGRSFRFQPMPSSERRAIHLALAEERGVRTESHGSGTGRYVMVLPD